MARNQLRSDECMKQLRYGFRLMWLIVPGVMRRFNVGMEGSFDVRNGHGGLCWGWPRECKLTNSQAKTIALDIYTTRSLTLHQTIVVRKSLAYAFELTGGKPGGNYPGVKTVWKVTKHNELAAAKGRVIPLRIPVVPQLSASFGKDWTPESTLSLIEYSSGYICAHDLFLYGLRSTEDVNRVKKSTEHTFDWQQGWQCTSFTGGRAKLCGSKKGTRPWSIWTTCFCKGDRHQNPPEDFCLQIKEDGNPRDPSLVTWTTSCPLSCLQLLWQLQETPRRYGKWLESGRFGKSNLADPARTAIDWMVAQGACTESTRYDRNSGRKSVARYTRRLGLDFGPIFQMVGDLQMPNSSH